MARSPKAIGKLGKIAQEPEVRRDIDEINKELLSHLEREIDRLAGLSGSLINDFPFKLNRIISLLKDNENPEKIVDEVRFIQEEMSTVGNQQTNIHELLLLRLKTVRVTN